MERDVERWLRRQIEGMGGLFFKFTSPGNAGVPDRIAVLPGGLVWFVELKDDGGQPSRLQKWQIARLRAKGIPATVVRGRSDAAALADKIRGLLGR